MTFFLMIFEPVNFEISLVFKTKTLVLFIIVIQTVQWYTMELRLIVLSVSTLFYNLKKFSFLPKVSIYIEHFVWELKFTSLTSFLYKVTFKFTSRELRLCSLTLTHLLHISYSYIKNSIFHICDLEETVLGSRVRIGYR